MNKYNVDFENFQWGIYSELYHAKDEICLRQIIQEEWDELQMDWKFIEPTILKITLTQHQETIKMEFTKRELEEIKLWLMEVQIKTMQYPFKDAETEEIMENCWTALEKIREVLN